MQTNKKRTPWLETKVVLSILILTLLTFSVYSLSAVRASNKAVQVRIQETRAEIEELKERLNTVKEKVSYCPNESPVCGLSSVECEP